MQIAPPFPAGRPTCFRSTVHGTIFAGRDHHLDTIQDGDILKLIADPPVQNEPEVWVHPPTAIRSGQNARRQIPDWPETAMRPQRGLLWVVACLLAGDTSLRRVRRW